ncbi:MAG: hypothetical protein QG650_1142 [Patescibacteria group bacterium]|nr:hypothetical protein [Patescibacteria group bacterium]
MVLPVSGVVFYAYDDFSRSDAVRIQVSRAGAEIFREGVIRRIEFSFYGGFVFHPRNRIIANIRTARIRRALDDVRIIFPSFEHYVRQVREGRFRDVVFDRVGCRRSYVPGVIPNVEVDRFRPFRGVTPVTGRNIESRRRGGNPIRGIVRSGATADLERIRLESRSSRIARTRNRDVDDWSEREIRRLGIARAGMPAMVVHPSQYADGSPGRRFGFAVIRYRASSTLGCRVTGPYGGYLLARTVSSATERNGGSRS